MLLPISFSPLLCYLAAFALAAPVVEAELPPLKNLNKEDFTSSIAKGLWLVEWFSPYCPHCRHFEPTWRALTDEFKTAETTSNFYMAQVNCITQGDLCTANKIKYYPMMKLYIDGEEKEVYDGDRDQPALTKYINEKVAEYVKTVAPPEAKQEVLAPKAHANLDGKLLHLTSATFKASVEEGPLFVKFFAPWCGHCKKLAPTWIQLSELMKGLMNVAEVNCDENSSLCRQEGVEGYPMLYLYKNGRKVEYRGSRKLDALSNYAKKAVNPGLQAVDSNGLMEVIKSEKVAFLLLHTISTSTYDIGKVEEASKGLLGGPPMLKSLDAAVWNQFDKDPNKGPILVAIKHGEEASSTALDGTTPVASITQWLSDNKHPLYDELTGDNFQAIMGAEAGALVVLVAMDTERYTGATLDRETSKLREMARTWNSSGKKVLNRPVVFVWMDGVKWTKWLKSMYGIRQPAMPAVVVADHQALVYYDTDTLKNPIPYDGQSIIQVLDSINAGGLKPKNSENIIERTMRGIHTKFSAFEAYFSEHPFRALGFIGAFVTLIVIGLWKLIQMDIEPVKHGRLD